MTPTIPRSRHSRALERIGWGWTSTAVATVSLVRIHQGGLAGAEDALGDRSDRAGPDLFGFPDRDYARGKFSARVANTRRPPSSVVGRGRQHRTQDDTCGYSIMRRKSPGSRPRRPTVTCVASFNQIYYHCPPLDVPRSFQVSSWSPPWHPKIMRRLPTVLADSVHSAMRSVNWRRWKRLPVLRPRAVCATRLDRTRTGHCDSEWTSEALPRRTASGRDYATSECAWARPGSAMCLP